MPRAPPRTQYKSHSLSKWSRPLGRLFLWPGISRRKGGYMQFFTSAITTLQTLVVALGAGLGVWGVVNLLEGYGSDNPGSNAHVR